MIHRRSTGPPWTSSQCHRLVRVPTRLRVPAAWPPGRVQHRRRSGSGDRGPVRDRSAWFLVIAAVALGIAVDRYGEPGKPNRGSGSRWRARRSRCVHGSPMLWSRAWRVMAGRRSRSAAAGIILGGRTWLPRTWPGAPPRRPDRPGCAGVVRGRSWLTQDQGFGFGTRYRTHHDPVRARPDGNQRRQALASGRGPGDGDRRGRSP